MPARFVYSGVTVNAQVKGLIVLNEGFIQSRQKDITASAQFVNGHYEQSVIFPGIASNQRGVEVSSGTVCCQNFPGQ